MGHLHGTYNFFLVVLSVAISFISTFTAIGIYQRAWPSSGRFRTFWMVCSAVVLGLGIWSMHFIGMLAFHLPLKVTYHYPILFLSMVLPIFSSLAVLYVIARPILRPTHLLLGSLLLCLALVSMHYTGMSAMRMNATLSYHPLWFLLSIVIAYGISFASMRILFLLRMKGAMSKGKWTVAVVLGLGAAAMHYAGMYAAVFVPMNDMIAAEAMHNTVAKVRLAALIGVSMICILSAALVSLYLDRKFVVRSAIINERRYLSIFRHNPDMVCLFDLNGKLLQANPATETITGYSVSSYIHRFFTDFLDRRDRRKVMSHFHKAAQGIPRHLEFTIRHRDGHPVILSATMVPLIVEGKVADIYIIAKDITRQRREEEELVRAKEAAEAAALAKSEFLSMMSHEVRTPLNGVIAVSELLMETTLDKEQKEYVDMIRKSGAALLAVINDVLDFSKAEAGKMIIEEEPFQLESCLEETFSLFMAHSRERNLELSYTLDPSLPAMLIGDVIRLRQVLVNLVGNALKFTEHGGVFVRVNGHAINERHLEVEFLIRDTGIGIPADKRDQLFQPFTQLDSSMARKYGGTGLGLAICKKMVELMGGEIRTEPADGEGSIFIFTIRTLRPAAGNLPAREEQNNVS